MNTRQQITKYARIAVGFVRLARSSPSNPEALVNHAANMAAKLIDVSRTITDDREALVCWKAGVTVQNMIRRSFGCVI